MHENMGHHQIRLEAENYFDSINEKDDQIDLIFKLMDETNDEISYQKRQKEAERKDEMKIFVRLDSSSQIEPN
jgi:hypothetical protein